MNPNKDKLIEEMKKELDGFRLNVVLGLDVDYDVYKESDIIRAFEKALSSANKQIKELKYRNNVLEKDNKVLDGLFRKLNNPNSKLKQQLKSQRDDIFKIINIELRCSSSDLKVGKVCEDEDCLNCSKKNDILRKIEHLKQTHKEKK